MILLVALLVAVPAGMVFAEMGNGQSAVQNIAEQETPEAALLPDLTPPNLPPPDYRCPEEIPEPTLVVVLPPTGEPPAELPLTEGHDGFGSKTEEVSQVTNPDGDVGNGQVGVQNIGEQKTPEAAVLLDLTPPSLPPPGYLCPEEIPEPTPVVVLPPIGEPAAELPLTEGHHGSGSKTQEVSEVTDTHGDVGIATITSGIWGPWRDGRNAVGGGWTRALDEPAVTTSVYLGVALWWWDGARWVRVGRGSDIETTPCPQGWITASAVAMYVNAATGWYAVTSVHTVHVDGVRHYYARRESPHQWLTFP